MQIVRNAANVRTMLRQAIANVRARWPADFADYDADPIDFINRTSTTSPSGFEGVHLGVHLLRGFEHQLMLLDGAWGVTLTQEEWDHVNSWTNDGRAKLLGPA